MCTFRITNYKTKDVLDSNLKLGGPDFSNTIEINGIYFTHHLLSITGGFTPQPIVKNNFLFMLMGEIYNYDNKFPSDIYYIIDEYFKDSTSFISKLDGEYLIIIYNIINNLINIYTDTWRTRQVYLDSNKNGLFSISTLDKDKISLKENSHYIFDVNNLSLNIVNNNLYEWNLEQNNSSIEDCVNYFEKAVLKRYYPNMTLYLSGGVDSVATALCLSKNKKQFNSITVITNNLEDEETINQTLEFSKHYNNHIFIDYPCVHNIEIRKLAKNVFNSKVSVMANGADELENYISKGKSSFTSWPKDLTTIFPWENFYEGQNRKLLNFHESMCLRHGIELRSIFYDLDYAQSWINILPELKNIENKLIQKHYLRNFNIKLPTKIAGMGQRVNEYDHLHKNSKNFLAQ